MEYELVPVKDHNNLVRDPVSNSIINTDQSEYDTYISRRKLRLAEKNKVSSVEEDLANLKGEINEIKSLLKELVNGN